jgi:hypothetical protein
LKEAIFLLPEQADEINEIEAQIVELNEKYELNGGKNMESKK